jgi:hypothetical protein
MRAPFAALTLGVLVLSACSNTGTVPLVVTQPEPALEVYAAGSLRGALTVIAKDFEVRRCLHPPIPTTHSAWHAKGAGKHHRYLCATPC